MVAFDKNGQGYFTFDEFYNLDVVQDLHKKFNKSCADKAIKCLYNAYKNHINSLGLNERKRYALSQIKKIIFKNNVFVVHYKNNDFYNYTIGGDWY